MDKVETILECRWLIPIEPHDIVLENYAVVIDNKKIKALLPIQDAHRKYHSNEVIELNEHAVMPGFINAHTHSPMVLFKGLADDLPLMDWLNNHIWPAEKKWLNPEFIQDSMELAIAEMITNGTTCFNEHFFFPEVIAKQVEKAHIRACIGLPIINIETAWSKDEEDCYQKGINLYATFKKNPLITFSLAPHAPYTTTDTILKKIGKFSEENAMPIHMHVHETAYEIVESLEKYGKRPLRRLYELGLLSERFQAVHMTQINAEDIELLNKSKANVTHCPESNLKLASGYCPVETLLQNQINVALGTDGAASNNNLDMIGEMRTAALIGKTVAESATAVNAANILRMSTINGAKALGLSDKIGSIEVGKEADLIAINLNHFNTQPLYNPISQIVYAASNNQITDVWVAGKRLLKNQKLTMMNEGDLLKKSIQWSKRISS